MTAEPSSQAPEPSPTWPVLAVGERRVLGVLIEKAKTTPDVYPLSINALVTGCNQKSNRDPLLDLADPEVEDLLVALQKKGLAIKITGGRVIRWRHALYEAWHVDKVELAILAELLLRGPQTEGELRTRASRMEPIDDLDTLRTVLRRLAERKLVCYLSPEGRRGTAVTHGFHADDELDRLRQTQKLEPELVSAARAAPAPVGQEKRFEDALTEIAALKKTVAELQPLVADLTEQVRLLKEGLGL